MAKKKTDATAPTGKSAAPPRRRATSTASSPVRRRTKATAGAQPAQDPTPDEIAEAAYHRYLNRGGQPGADFDDWVEAERELREKRAR